MSSPPLPTSPAWAGHDTSELFDLEALSPTCHRTRYHDGNPNGRAFGGQILGQAMAAALRTVPPERVPTMMQLVFLQGARADIPIDFDVTALQDGKRFSSRHVRGAQAGRFICDAHVSCQQDPSGLEFDEPLLDAVPDPESLHTMAELSDIHATEFMERGWQAYGKPCLDMCLVDYRDHLFEPGARPHMKFWLRLRGPARDTAAEHAAALAYLSDYWITTSCLTSHRALATSAQIYMASLNHSIWFHEPCATNDWLLFVSDNIRTTQGRGLVVVKIYNRARRHVATVSQECLITMMREM